MRIICVLFVLAVIQAAALSFNSKQMNGQIEKEAITQNSKIIERTNVAHTPRTHTLDAFIDTFNNQLFGRKLFILILIYFTGLAMGSLTAQCRHAIYTFFTIYIIVTAIIAFILQDTISFTVYWDKFLNLFKPLKALWEYLGTIRTVALAAGFWCGVKNITDREQRQRRVVMR